jgi:hypothetical protein
MQSVPIALIVTLNGVGVTGAANVANSSGYVGIQGEAGVVEYRSIQIKPVNTR